VKKKVTTFLRGILSSSDPDRLEREIQSIVDDGEEKGLLDEQSGDMIENILAFRDTVVREVMIPRTEMVAVSSQATVEEILESIRLHGHTRMPVYQGNIDNIVGVMNVKDLLKFWSKPLGENDILQVLRKPYYIPETKNTHILLHELRQRKHHMAIVIDEYGGTSGLVTLEDLIEEIVGEIHDEHDSREGRIVPLADGFYLLDGRVEIEEIEEHFQVKLPRGKYETVSGLILHHIMRIPEPGETIVIEPFEIVIESADERTIRKIRMRKTPGEHGKD
jgi:CBS domain containing-hemolysin-like protein